jgi:hypothetical protein
VLHHAQQLIDCACKQGVEVVASATNRTATETAEKRRARIFMMESLLNQNILGLKRLDA